MKTVQRIVFLVVIGCSPINARVASSRPTIYSSDSETRYSAGYYTVANNMWGKADAGMAPYSQHLDVYDASQYNVTAEWTWAWPAGTGRIKAYPSVIYGKDPWREGSTATTLPVQLSKMGDYAASYDAEVTASPESRFNTAFDLWITSDALSTSQSVTAEVMIWINHQNMSAGPFSGRVTMDAQEYYFGAPNSDRGWMYTAFQKVNQESVGSISITRFLDFLIQKGHIASTDYLSDIEFGTEIQSGSGTMHLNRYSVMSPPVPTPASP